MFDSYSSDQASDIDPRDLDALEARARDIREDDERAEADAENDEPQKYCAFCNQPHNRPGHVCINCDDEAQRS